MSIFFKAFLLRLHKWMAYVIAISANHKLQSDDAKIFVSAESMQIGHSKRRIELEANVFRIT